MKHVIVIETVDVSEGGHIVGLETRRAVELAVEGMIEKVTGKICIANSRFNVSSAIAAVHEMYGALEWKG